MEQWRSKVTEGNPFIVPEGYFDNLTARVMDSLPKEEKRRRYRLFTPMSWAAAAASVVLLFGTYWLVDDMVSVKPDVVSEADLFGAEDEYIYQAIIGNGEIISYLDEEY